MTLSSFIYVASPYSDPDPAVRQDRYDAVKAFCAARLENGYHVFSPIVHWHPTAKEYDLPTDAAFWFSYNLSFLSTARALWVLKLPGWEQSKGVKAEIGMTDLLNLPLVYKEMGVKERAILGVSKDEAEAAAPLPEA